MIHEIRVVVSCKYCHKNRYVMKINEMILTCNVRVALDNGLAVIEFTMVK